MATVGLVPFARVALGVATAVVPPVRHPRSKHGFTQPQLLAIRCLLRYEDWTFREAEGRLAEHRERRRALRLRRVPDYTTRCRFLARLDPTDVARAVAEIGRRLPPRPGPPGGRRCGAIVAVDATGLTTGAVSPYCVRRLEEATGQRRSRAHWLKWLIASDTARRLMVAQDPHRGPVNAVRRLPGVLAGLPADFAVAWVVADRECDREANHQSIHRVLGAASAIPVRRPGAPRPGAPVSGRYRAQMAQRFPKTA